jgi:hypothetical protein
MLGKKNGIPWNFCRRTFQDKKFHGIFVAGSSRTKNSTEFRCRKFQDKKFHGIFVAGSSGTKNSTEFRKSTAINFSRLKSKKKENN